MTRRYLESTESSEVAIRFWNFISERNWEATQALLHSEFEAYWPQSNEKIIGPDNFIEVNRVYPGTHKIAVLNSTQEPDCAEFIDKVITEVMIESKMPDGKKMKLFAVSIFEIQDGLIMNATEYWADCYPAPEWRKHLVQEYAAEEMWRNAING